MSGFFTSSELSKTTKIKVDFNSIEPDCIKCNRSKECKHPKLKISGKGKKEILIIGDSPEKEDDILGTHWNGEAGHTLKQYFGDTSISVVQDCWSVFAINCYKPVVPDKKEIQYCRVLVQKAIHELKPKYIITLGNRALESLIGESFSDLGIERWRGLCIPDQDLNAFVIPLHEPHQIYRNDKGVALKKVYKRDIKSVELHLKKKFKINKDVHTKILLSYTAVTDNLKQLLKKKSKIYFDYETTGLKPHRKGHKIVTIAYAVSATEAYAFPFQWKDHFTKDELKKITNLWKQVLEDRKIKKMGHNTPFENMWSRIIIDAVVKGWSWDTMNTAHILDNRPKFSSLKFQSYIKFGIRPYDKHIKKFLESANETEFNTVEKVPFKDLLEYNGFDCLYGWRLYEQQLTELVGRKKLIEANSFFFKGSLVLSEMQLNGSCSDLDYYKKEYKKLGKKVKKISRELLSGKEAIKFKKKIGKNLDIGSSKDLGILFYDILNAPKAYTANKDTSNYSVDKDALAKIKLPFVDKLLEMRKFEKARGTYLAQFIRETCNNKIHGFFGLNIPVSYRSSAFNPNWQNLPKRDKVIKLLIRKGITPRPGCKIIEADFGGAEVITSASYHKDKNFINYLLDKSTDMHRDIAKDLWLFSTQEWQALDEEVQDKIRFYAKNMWTFAQFYGDWFGSCAPNLWEIADEIKINKKETLKQRMYKLGIRELGEINNGDITPGSFLEHCRNVEKIMWEDRFGEYTQWKDDIEKEYHKKGFIETYLGFQYSGIMSRNQVTNYPIQGTSFHLLLYTLITVSEELKKRKMKTKLIAQIHDSIIADVPGNEEKKYIKLVTGIINNLHKKFKWLALPMTCDIEMSKVREDGGNFGEMTKFKMVA